MHLCTLLILPCIIYHDHAGSFAFSGNCASLVILVLRFFADRNVELMRATTSSPVFIANVFQASIPSSATYFIALPLSIILALLQCFSCLDPIIVYLAADILPTFPILLPCFVCESCLSLASRSACLGLWFDVVGSYHVTPSTY